MRINKKSVKTHSHFFVSKSARVGRRLAPWLAVLVLAAFACGPAHSQTLTWDPTGGGTTDGAGAWLTVGDWWNGASNVNWTSGDNAIFGNGGAGGAVTLASPTVVNSITFNSFTGTYTIGTAGQTLTINGGITMNSGAGAATIISPITLGAAQSWTNNDDSLLTIGTGAVTNGGFLLTIGGTGNTTVSSVIGGSGGLTKTGAGTLTLSGANTYTGGVTMTAGTASFTSTGLGSAANKITFAGNSTLQWGAATTTDLSSRLIISTGVTATLDTGANNVTFASVFGLENNSKGTLNKTGTGILTLGNTVNQFAGNTVITNGKVALGGQYAMWQSAYDTTGSTGAIGLNVTGQVAPWLGGLAGSVDLATGVTGYSAITTLTLNPQSGSSVSYGGVIANTTTNLILSKTGLGTQTLTGTNTYSGATTVWAGTLALSGASGSALSSAFTVRGGTLSLDNSGGTFINRLADATALSLGSLSLSSYNNAGTQTETVGVTTFAVGGKVTITNGTGTAGTTLALTGTPVRSVGAAIDFVGVNGTLGGGAATSPNVTSGLAFPGGSNGILPWATVNGTTWAGTASTTSIVAYASTFVDPTSAASAATSNAQLTGSGTMNAVKSFNSLNVISSGASQSFDLSTLGVLTLTSGGILKSGTNAYTISGSATSAITSSTELIAHVDGGALTISAPLNTAIVNLAKGGTGDLILSGARAGTMAGNISIAGGQLEFQGATTTLNGVVTGLGGLTVNLNAGQTLTMANNSNSYAGPTIVKGGYLNAGGYPSQGLPGGINQTPGTNTSQIMSNLILNGGVMYYTYVTNKDLGAGPGQVQVLAGTSGFVNTAGSGGASGFTLDGSREIVWGSTYFNPTVFVHSTVGDLTLNLANGFDLNGSTRTILVGDATYFSNNGGVSQLGGVIRTSSGTAGLTKTGVGNLLLSGASTYNGATTVSAGTLSFSGNANVASANPLGQSSAAAANLLLANGTTLKYSGAAASTDRSFTINGTAAGNSASLDASGSAAINFSSTASLAYGTVNQTRTLTLTGTNINNNTLAANIADNGTGAVSLTKTGAGLWVLSGTTSSYTGPTTITAGTLSVSATANLGNAASNLVFNGGTLQITNTTNLPNFSTIGHTVSFTSGQTVGLDILGTFTADQTLNQGTGGLTKAGAGTLLINSAHTYTGVTTVSAGILQLNDGGVFSSVNLNLAGGTFAVNRSATTILGTNIPAFIYGTSSLDNTGAGTLVLNAPTFHTGNTSASVGNITLSHASAIQNSALNTTGAGFVTLSGVTTPIFGGLSNTGTTRNLATVINSGYSGVTNLTLNPQSGSTFTYGGVIADGATGMSLTKIGAGTQILQGTNTYSGATNIKVGTLTLSGAAGAIAGTSGLTFAGGTLQLTNTTSAEGAVDRVGSVGITSNGGAITYTNTATSGFTYAETLGALTLTSGQLTVTSTNAATGIGTESLTFANGGGGLASHTNNTSTVAFIGGGNLGTATTNRILISNQSNTAAGAIIGAWASAGVTTAGDYAAYVTNGITPLAATQRVNDDTVAWNTAWANDATGNINFGNTTVGTTLTANRVLNTLRHTGGAETLVLSTFNLTTQGILQGGTGALTISGAGGVITAGGNPDYLLYVTTGTAQGIMISAPINNNGANAVTLVSSGINTLTLSSTTSNFSGGIVLNAGSLSTTSDTNLGASGGGIIVNGTSQWTMGAAAIVSYARSLTVNDGAVLTLSSGNAAKTVTGVLSGSGSLVAANSTGYYFTNTGNDFTGEVTSLYEMKFASIGDSAKSFNISNASTGLIWTGGAKAFALRPLTLNAAGNGIFANDGTDAVSFAADLVTTGAAGARTLTLGGSYTTIANTFSGKITDAPGSVISVAKAGAGTWNLSAANTYTGATTVTTGTLEVTNLANGASNSSVGASSNVAGNLILNGGTLRYTGAAVSTDRLFSLQTSSSIVASGTGAVNFTNTGSMGFNGGVAAKTLTLTGANTDNNTLAAGIGDNTGATSITKNSIGTWILSGTNTYTGATNFSGGGTLVLDYGTSDTTKLSDTVNALTLAGGTLTMKGASGSHVEIVTSTSLSAGGTFLTRDGVNTAKLRMNAITRAAGGTISFGSATLADTDTVNINSILGGWATLGNDWAVSAASGTDIAVTALASYTGALPSGAAGAATANYTLSGPQNQTLSVLANTVKITGTGTGDTLSLNATNLTTTYASATSLGGILYTGGGDGNYNITGSGTLIPGTSAGELIITTTTGNLNVSTPIIGGGAGLLTKAGAGRLILNTASTFTGAVRVNEGVLRLANATASGTIAGGITVQNGAALELTGGITIGAEALTITGTGVSNAGALRNIASNTSSYAGAVTIGTGGARINSDSSGALTLTAGVITSQFSDVTFGGAGNTILSTVAISGAGGLMKDGAGTATLNFANTFTGGTFVNDGTLALGTSNVLTDSGAVAVGGGILNIQGNSDTVAAVTLTSGSITGSTGVLTGSSYALQSGTVSAILGGSGVALTKSTGGTVTLSGTNTYTGATTVSAGTLSLGSGGTTGRLTATTSITNNGNLTINRSNAFSQATDLGAGVLISGTGSFTQAGAGTTTLTATNTYTGTTTVQAGALVAGANAPASANGAFGNAASALVLGNASTLAGDAPSVLIGGAFTVARDITVGSGAATAYNATLGGRNTSGTSTFSGGLTLTNTGSYTTTLQAATGGTVDFTGVWTNEGNKAIAIGSSGNTGTVKLTSAISTSGGISVNYGTLLLAANLGAGAVTVEGTGTLSIGSNSSFAGALVLNAGTLNLNGNSLSVSSLSGSAGTITSSVASTPVILTANASGNSTFSGVIQDGVGSVGLTKSGVGSLTLAGVNSYTGATTVAGGTLVVNGSIQTDVSIASGAFLSGSGTIGDAAFVGRLSGTGTISPGSITGAAGILSAYTFNPSAGLGASFEFTSAGLPDFTQPANSLNDVLNLTSIAADPFADSWLTSANAIDIYFNVTSILPADRFSGGMFVNFGAGLYTDTATLIAAVQNATYTYWVKSTGPGVRTFNGVNYDSFTSNVTLGAIDIGTSGFLTEFVVVPEPDTIALAGLGIAMAAWTIWKRRRIAQLKTGTGTVSAKRGG